MGEMAHVRVGSQGEAAERTPMMGAAGAWAMAWTTVAQWGHNGGNGAPMTKAVECGHQGHDGDSGSENGRGSGSENGRDGRGMDNGGSSDGCCQDMTAGAGASLRLPPASQRYECRGEGFLIVLHYSTTI